MTSSSPERDHTEIAPMKPPEAAPISPLRFSLTSTVKPSRFSEEAFISCKAYEEVAEELNQRLFCEHAVLRNALESGMSARFGPLGLAYYDVMGRFDRAVCHLRLNRAAPSRFFVHTYFYFDTRLVAAAAQAGSLAS